VRHRILQTSDTQGSRRRENDAANGSLFTTLQVVIHKRKRTKKKIRNRPRLWISRSPTKLCKAVTVPPAYPQPVAVPYTRLAASFSSAEEFSGRLQLIFAADQKDLISTLQFFIRAWIDDAGAIPFDPHNARPGLRTQP
jgi:hypothetical protein